MSLEAFFTAANVGNRKTGLQGIRAGPCWVYVDSLTTFEKKTTQHMELVSKLLGADIILTLDQLEAVGAEVQELSSFEKSYLHFLADAACACGRAEKLLCSEISGRIYPAYVSRNHLEEVEAILDTIWDELQAKGRLDQKQASLVGWGTQDATRMARMLLDHLIFIGVAWPHSKWSVRV